MLVAAPAPLPADSGDVTFADRYAALAGDVPPRAYSVLAYDAAQALLAAITAGIEEHGQPTRAGTAEALAAVAHEGVGTTIAFDETGGWAAGQVWLYTWRNGRLVRTNR
jgi:ABC-type branched-subunit amino acid transport system substrate-binding protein